MPKVSIITALHNKAPYIGNTIGSVLAQTFRNWELIIIENHSSDGGPSIVSQLASTDNRIRLLLAPPEVCGPGAARNIGLASAMGEWVLFLDADDLISPEYLEAQLACAHHHKDASIVVGSWLSIEAESGRPIGVRRPICWRENVATLTSASFGCTPWALHAAIVKTDWLRPLREWPEELDQLISEDLAFWFRAVLMSRIAWSDCEGAIYLENTVNSRNDTQNAHKWLLALDGAAHVNISTLKSFGIKCTPAMDAAMFRAFEGMYRTSNRAGDKKNAKIAFDYAVPWLRRYGGCNPPMLARKILGIRLVSNLSEIIRKLLFRKRL